MPADQKYSSALPFRRLKQDEVRQYENCVPLYELKIAAGGFSDEQQVEDHEWVELPEEFRPRKGLFVAQVVGESMNRRIPNGSWCLFREDKGVSRIGLGGSGTGQVNCLKINLNFKKEQPKNHLY